ncbi:hypothetical protein Sjap_000684 [Stephania japonica]|uniref:Uncharacterized protein n=1 Tax=Stephania japonica TaxID=461633 RepID=A0AAP0PSR2_9MAGN
MKLLVRWYISACIISTILVGCISAIFLDLSIYFFLKHISVNFFFSSILKVYLQLTFTGPFLNSLEASL